MKYLIYKVTFPNNKIYIGITSKSLEFRKKVHYNQVNSGSKFKFHNALRKYQGQEIWEELLYSKTWKDICKLERKLIKKFDSCNRGYNSTAGGEGNFNPCKEVRKKMSLWQKGKKKSKEHRKALSKAKLGKKYGPRKKGTGENIAKSLGMRPFKVFDINKKCIGKFSSASSCARYLNTYSACISRCLRNPEKYKSYKGYTFKFLNGEVSHFTV